MEVIKKVGIWMDHSSAHVMEFTDEIKTVHVDSKFTHHDKVATLARSENVMHHKEHDGQMAYYKHLGEVILNYQEVLLFGPTDAKKELHNHLATDHHFDGIKIEVLSADKMTEHQEHAFVRDHFSKAQH